jgi:SAM-dependent methyltransferase
VFGEAADLYDRFRPSYPDRLIDEVVALAGLDGRSAVLEVGAGTGKATALFAARGIPVVGVEPSGEMAEVARRNLSSFPEVEIEQSDLEHWDSGGRRFPLVLSAQAWHWVEPSVGYTKARDLLLPGGWLAVFWNRFVWESSELHEEMKDVYHSAAPELTRAGGMHPSNLCPDAEADWEGEIAAVPGLGAAEIRHYEWERTYSTGEYVGLLGTASDVLLLDEATRSALFAAVSEVIDTHGGANRMAMRTQLCLARRV